MAYLIEKIKQNLTDTLNAWIVDHFFHTFTSFMFEVHAWKKGGLDVILKRRKNTLIQILSQNFSIIILNIWKYFSSIFSNLKQKSSMSWPSILSLFYLNIYLFALRLKSIDCDSIIINNLKISDFFYFPEMNIPFGYSVLDNQILPKSK